MNPSPDAITGFHFRIPGCSLVGLFLLAAAILGAAERPNIVLILSDDQAWSDYGFMGHPHIETPHLDRLAAESVLFKRGYVPTPLCRPSLMSLATGLHPHQHGITGNDPGGGWRNQEFPREDLLVSVDSLSTLPEILTDNGYLTFQSGKWWEGSFQRGGFTHGMTEGSRHGDKGLVIGREGLQPVFDFIEMAETAEKPFYVWYAPFLPHTPHNPPDAYIEKYSGLGLHPHVARYYAMCEWFDATCGELVAYLEENGLRDNTLIYYACDNGWIQSTEDTQAAPGSKQTVTEAGIRTPIFFSWPARFAPQSRPERITTLDLFPTILSMAGIEPPEGLPGMDLSATLRTGAPIDREHITGAGYTHDILDPADPRKSLLYLWVINQDWKLIRTFFDGEKTASLRQYRDWHAPLMDQPVMLYHLESDPHERLNLAERFPRRVEELTAVLQEWYPDAFIPASGQKGTGAAAAGN